MPGKNGIEVLKAAKAIYPDTNVILISAYGTIETAVEAMRLGAMDFITKPFQIAELDLEERQMGDLLGARQAGEFELRHARLPADTALLERARTLARRMLDADGLRSDLESAGELRAMEELARTAGEIADGARAHRWSHAHRYYQPTRTRSVG